MEKIFEHRKNVIWDENDCYILEYVPTGAKCRFDHADAPLEAIKEALMRDGNATPNGTKGLSIRPCRDHK